MRKTALLICGGIYCTIALCAATLSMSQNVLHGLATGMAPAVALLLAELGRISIPVVAALLGKFSKKMWIVLITCGVASVTAAVANYSDQKADQLLAATQTNAKIERFQAKYNGLVAELASITVIEAPADLETLLATYKDKAEKEAARGFCGPKCSAAEKAAAETTAKLAQAHRKVALKTEIAAAQTQLDNSRKVEASGLARIIAKFTGFDVEKIAMVEGIFNNALFILLIEQLVYLIIPGLSYLREAFEGDVEEVEVPVVVQASAPVIQFAERREEEALQRLTSMILRSPDGSICCSGRELARRLDIPNSTFSGWLASWIKSGKIKATDVTAHKKRFAA